nr:HAMP domain-containing sensor histidine kinase [uncultured Schaedlerella sp.]
MAVWCMITAALVALSTGAVWYGQGKYRERELAEISSMLECVLDGREFPEYVPCRETLSSKIQHQLSRLQRMTKGYHARLEQDRDSIKNLITEIAHQMRTPLANIETYLDFLQDPDLSRTERESYLKAASLSEKKIHFLAESFIRMSRLEHRIIRIRPGDTDLLLTLEEAADQVRRKAQEQGLRIRTDFPEQLLHTHDADWLGEAVFNLLDNAVKYSLPAADKAAGENCQEAGSRTGERNEILLGARQNEMFVRIWVSDHGTGIEEGDEAKVFQRFYRGSNAKKTEGFGLGLYLAREIVLLHNGFVKLKRQKDGTCVEIYLERSSTASR